LISAAAAGFVFFKKRGVVAEAPAKPAESAAKPQTGTAAETPSSPASASAGDPASPPESSAPVEEETKFPTDLVRRAPAPSSAPPPRAGRAPRPSRPPGSVAKQAGELWNKKDEL
jgi:hypothetical protein